MGWSLFSILDVEILEKEAATMQMGAGILEGKIGRRKEKVKTETFLIIDDDLCFQIPCYESVD